jgi:hypothetical protein
VSRTLHATVLPILLCGALALPQMASSQVSVEGAWTVSEWTVNGKTSPAQPGMFIFTSTHYSIFHVNRPEPRAKPAQTGAGGMTDAEKAVAFDEITANSGRYVIEGDLLTTRAFIAKQPAYMALWPDNEQEYRVRRDGDTLTLTFANGNVAKLVRREGQDRPR